MRSPKAEKENTVPERAEKHALKRYAPFLPVVCVIALILMSLLLLFAGIRRDGQSIAPIGLPIEFRGEYSRDKATWRPLTAEAVRTDETIRNALGGDLYLRGNFSENYTGGTVQFYMNQITCSISMNGELLNDYGAEVERQGAQAYGSEWESWKSSDWTADDVVEIHLHNPCAAGNPRAYLEFLGNMYVCANQAFGQFMLHNGKSSMEDIRNEEERQFDTPLIYSGQPWRIMGAAVLALSAALLGVALADTLQGASLGEKAWAIGFTAMAMGVSILLDTSDVELWSRNLALNTYGAQLGQMLAMLFLSWVTAAFLHGKPRKIVRIAVGVNGVFHFTLLSVCLITALPLYRTLPLVLITQTAALALTLACALWALSRERDLPQRIQLGIIVGLLCAFLVEIANSLLGWWTRGLLANTAFLLAFAVVLIWIAKEIPAKYQAARAAADLKLQMAESRIAIMLSQIQPHFLYNALSTIRALCRRDPGAAERATIEFTEFLRGNMDSLTADKPISFEQELAHTKSYLELEKMRFPQKLNIDYDIEATLFRLPTLTLQPLVENAVRYGVTKRVEGGTVTIATRETDTAFEVSVTDDGVGYDPLRPKEDGRTHIGIDNVRKRLKTMCDGTLEIESRPNVGTKAVITLPKEGSGC